MILEVCVDSVDSAVAAQQGGADRIELCADLDQGGITPSFGMIKSVRDRVTVRLHVMIRPRVGGFCYSELEFGVMKIDIQEAKRLGADGVVFGILTKGGTIDRARTEQLVNIARPMSVTFHRAFDEVPDSASALSELTAIGVDRVLTSGGAQDVASGRKKLADLVRDAGSFIKVLAGGGVTLENVADLVSATGVNEIHVLSSVSEASDASLRDSRFFGSHRRSVDASKVRRMVDILRQLPVRK